NSDRCGKLYCQSYKLDHLDETQHFTEHCQAELLACHTLDCSLNYQRACRILFQHLQCVTSLIVPQKSFIGFLIEIIHCIKFDTNFALALNASSTNAHPYTTTPQCYITFMGLALNF
ncbi:hypothetical protein OTU49_000167, partial [Cherax quadricarinatus]